MTDRWDTMTGDEIVTTVRDLVNTIPDDASADGSVVMVQAGPALDAILRADAEALVRIRRTRVGRWVIDGRTYRTKALALASVRKRAVGPLWLALLAPWFRLHSVELHAAVTA